MKKAYKILLGVLLGLFILLFLCFKLGIVQDVDNYWYHIIKKWQSNEITTVLKVITNLGGIVSLFFIAFITIMILLIGNKRKVGIAVAFNLMISSATYFILKSIIQRPRPLVEERLIEETGYSFPSGHATNNMAFYVLAICLIYPNIKNKKLRNILCIILGMIPIVIGFSRFYLRVHYLSDIIAGFCLGIINVILFMSFIYPKIK